jgi:glycosyltransferase involved in cell wall biosynthesis
MKEYGQINKLKIAIITNIIPSYREGFYDRLFARKDLFVKVYCQDYIPGMNIRTIHEKYYENVQLLKFVSAKREKIVWQFLPWKEILCEYDVIFVGGNPRVLSHAFLATYLQLFGKKVVLWTTAHSFRANLVTEKLRLLWSRIFDFIFVYTDVEVAYLRNKGFMNNFILGMNNGLDQKMIDATILKWPESRAKRWRQSQGVENRTLLLSCARLDEKNKFGLVVEALPLMIAQIPDLIWCVIGDGDDKIKLESIVNEAGLSNYVRFVGEVYVEDELAPWFLSSHVFVHPAAIGLSLLHSFGYGLPVVTHGRSELHGPEYAAFEPDITGRNFSIGDHQRLAETVMKLLQDRTALVNMNNYVFKVAREKYNVDVMVERFVEIARKAFTAGNRSHK